MDDVVIGERFVYRLSKLSGAEHKKEEQRPVMRDDAEERLTVEERPVMRDDAEDAAREGDEAEHDAAAARSHEQRMLPECNERAPLHHRQFHLVLAVRLQLASCHGPTRDLGRQLAADHEPSVCGRRTALALYVRADEHEALLARLQHRRRHAVLLLLLLPLVDRHDLLLEGCTPGV